MGVKRLVEGVAAAAACLLFTVCSPARAEGPRRADSQPALRGLSVQGTGFLLDGKPFPYTGVSVQVSSGMSGAQLVPPTQVGDVPALDSSGMRPTALPSNRTASDGHRNGRGPAGASNTRRPGLTREPRGTES